MRRIPRSGFHTARWKNGGGLTHEIARLEDGGALIWRISLAEVAANGPFSAFPGLTRVLTVIDGGGLDLESPEEVLSALPLMPVRFSGDTPIAARLRGGSCRDVNVIFDPGRVAARVAVLRPDEGATATAVLALAGEVRVGDALLAPEDFAWTDREPVRVGADGLALLIELAPATIGEQPGISP